MTIPGQTVAGAQGMANDRMAARDFAQKAAALYRINVRPPTRIDNVRDVGACRRKTHRLGNQ